jgi:hypothetical protein
MKLEEVRTESKLSKKKQIGSKYTGKKQGGIKQ